MFVLVRNVSISHLIFIKYCVVSGIKQTIQETSQVKPNQATRTLSSLSLLIYSLLCSIPEIARQEIDISFSTNVPVLYGVSGIFFYFLLTCNL